MTRIQATIAALSALLLATACAHQARSAEAGANAHNTPATAAAPAAAPSTPTATARSSDTGSDAAMASANAPSAPQASATSQPQASASANANPNANANATSNANPNAMASSNASASAAPASGEIQGRIEQVDPADHLVIAGSEQSGLGFDHFKADERTEVTIGGKKASLAEVQEGDQVRASFSGQGDALHVDKLQVTPRAGADDKAATKSGDDKR
jgi:hypothetical protein